MSPERKKDDKAGLPYAPIEYTVIEHQVEGGEVVNQKVAKMINPSNPEDWIVTTLNRLEMERTFLLGGPKANSYKEGHKKIGCLPIAVVVASLGFYRFLLNSHLVDVGALLQKIMHSIS